MRTPTIKSLCVKWQKRLGLSDWDIKIEVVHSDALQGDQAAVLTTATLRRATVRIADVNTEIEQSIIHELLHIHFALIDERFTKLENLIYEQAIEAIAWGLYNTEYVQTK